MSQVGRNDFANNVRSSSCFAASITIVIRTKEQGVIISNFIFDLEYPWKVLHGEECNVN